MKKLTKILILVSLFVPCLVCSQVDFAKGKWTINGSLAIPMGDFADEILEQESGFATVGIAVGADFSVPLSNPGLTWISSLSLVWNGSDQDQIEEELEEAYGSPVVNVQDVKSGSWISIPIMSGVQHRGKLSAMLDYYLMGQIGVNFVLPPSIEFEDGEYNLESGSSLGLTLGGGVVLQNNISIGIRYLSLGVPELDYEITYSGNELAEGEIDQPVNILLLTVGFTLQ